VVALWPQHTVFEEQQVTIRYFTEDYSLTFEPHQTFLQCRQTGHRSQLLYSFDIRLHSDSSHFEGAPSCLLIFDGLPQACKAFDLLEITPRERNVLRTNIPRNAVDVYSITF
jgi:hypothetical protein